MKFIRSKTQFDKWMNVLGKWNRSTKKSKKDHKKRLVNFICYE